MSAAIDRLVTVEAPFTGMGMWGGNVMPKLMGDDFDGPTEQWDVAEGLRKSTVSCAVAPVATQLAKVCNTSTAFEAD